MPDTGMDYKKLYHDLITNNPDRFDTNIPWDVWDSWYPLWDHTTGKFKSIKLDAGNNPVSGLFDKPTDCPDGTTAYGQNQCLPLDHPKIQGIKPGAGATALSGAGVFDLVNNLVFQRLSAKNSWAAPTPGLVPAGYTTANKGYGVIPGLTDSRYGGQASALALPGGGLAWGGIDPSWAGLMQIINPKAASVTPKPDVTADQGPARPEQWRPEDWTRVPNRPNPRRYPVPRY